MKKTFSIEWPDKYRNEVMNENNLKECLFSDAFIADVKLIIKEVIRCFLCGNVKAEFNKEYNEILCQNCINTLKQISG